MSKILYKIVAGMMLACVLCACGGGDPEDYPEGEDPTPEVPAPTRPACGDYPTACI